MLRKMWIASAMGAMFVVTAVVAAQPSQAEVFVRRPAVGTYFYYNGPPVAFVGPPVRIRSSAWDVGPYGPGYGWPYRQPLGFRVNIGH